MTELIPGTIRQLTTEKEGELHRSLRPGKPYILHPLMQPLEEAKKRIAELEAQLALAREALKTHGRHSGDRYGMDNACQSYYGNPCDCGLDNALTTLTPPERTG